jgi:pyridoxine 5-phosphate synthase
MIELGVNIDHVATVRQARRTYEPDPVWAAVEAHLGGADGITVHLREDRRHIQDEDVRRLRELTHIKLNLEMAATDEMVEVARRIRPEMAMLVPEGRHEVTTEGGLDIIAQENSGCARRSRVSPAPGSWCRVFIDAEPRQIEAAHRSSARGSARSTRGRMRIPSTRAVATRKSSGCRRARQARAGGRGNPRALGMRFNAGHALNYFNVEPVARLPRRARAAHRSRHRQPRPVRRACARRCAR